MGSQYTYFKRPLCKQIIKIIEPYAMIDCIITFFFIIKKFKKASKNKVYRRCNQEFSASYEKQLRMIYHVNIEVQSGSTL